nr:hypothetical protein [Tanacetum cinerariifolium]
MNYHPVLAENQSNSNAGFQDTGKAREEGTQTYSVSPDIHSLSCGDQTRKHGNKTENKDNGKSPVVTITGFKNLNEEFAECINNSSNEVNAAGPSVSAAGLNFLNSTNDFIATGPSVSAAGLNFSNNTNDFSAAGPSVSAAGLNFSNNTNDFSAVGPSVSAVGLNFTNSTNDFSAAGPSNAAMPNLEDLSHNADDVGAEADINNMESIISVSPIPTTRIHKDHPTSQIIGDLSLTTQTRSMARAVKDQEEPKRVHQALKDPIWIEAMQEELLQFKMQKVWILVDLPYGKRAIGTKWVYRNKKDERGIVIRNKASLVGQGHT